MAALSNNRLPGRYSVLIGTGGIGTGCFFAVQGNHTLGREESRKGRFLENRDYAKLHIVAHYVQVLMGRAFRTAPIGRVGNDEAGRALINEMAAVGMDMQHVRVAAGAPTMNCICILYADGSGGNLTTDNSACDELTGADVREAAPLFQQHQGRGIAAALPEVPLSARQALLELGGQFGFLRVASFTSQELHEGVDKPLLGVVDLLVLNRDEAAALSGCEASSAVPGLLDRARAKAGNSQNLIVTAGIEGSWAWDGERVEHQESYQANTVSAAGAGDAFLAGVLAGLASGLSLAESQQVGALNGALSTESRHTIHPDIDRGRLLAFADKQELPIKKAVKALLARSREDPGLFRQESHEFRA